MVEKPKARKMKKQILAIDDSKAIRYLLQTVLGRDYKVTTASDAASAMFWLTKKNLPDLIIADPRLPDTRDWELIQYLSTSGLFGNIPVIALSSLDKKETALKSKENGVRYFFQKPFNPIELVKIVEQVIANKPQFQEPSLKLV
jgi:CheY-like chemotaxis protein